MGAISVSVMIRFNHMVTQFLQSGVSFFANFAGEDRVDMAFCTGLRFRELPSRDLVMRNDLFVMLCFLHVFGEEFETSKTLATSHTLEDVSRLLISSAYPNVLTSDKFSWKRKLLFKYISDGWLRRRSH
jgi:hypothetical protein